MSIIDWFSDLLDFRYPWSESKVKGRILPLELRIAQEKDYDFWQSLRLRNEPYGVPKGYEEAYEDYLFNPENLVFIASLDGVDVATCGLHWFSESLLWFSYGLVDPNYQRKGIGTTLYFARLAMLSEHPEVFDVGMSALKTSLPFYERLGFRGLSVDQDEAGNLHFFAVLRSFNIELVQHSKKLIAEAGVILPKHMPPIPIRSTPELLIE